MLPSVESIKQETFGRLKSARLFIIEEGVDGEWIIHQWHNEGVAPQSSYPTKRLAAARLLQLLHIGPVAPQTHPEKICIGTVEKEHADA